MMACVPYRSLRLLQLWFGLACYGVSMDLMYRARLGLDCWDVLHQGLSKLTGIPMGIVIIIVGAIVLLGWIPLRERPGFGTACNAVLVGAVFGLVLPLIPAPQAMVVRVLMMFAGIALCGFATGMYVTVGWGAGPRDGLMTGISRRAGWSIRLTRTGIEVTVLAVGFLLGGQVGIGTLAFALLIGPVCQVFINLFGGPPVHASNSSEESVVLVV
jgi:uncharacterized membrane protein YczE